MSAAHGDAVLEAGNTQRMLLALALLQAAFPVEDRLNGVPDATRTVYADILSHWLSWGVPPTADAFDAAAVDALVNIGAVLRENRTLSAYPFSAPSTGTTVEYMGRIVSVFDAIAALGVARLARVPILVTAACVESGEPIKLIIKGDGTVPNKLAGAAGVVIRVPREPNGPFVRAISPGIRFVSAAEAPKQSGVLTLPEAAAVAAALLGFQRALLPA